jgi:hypothetical protein
MSEIKYVSKCKGAERINNEDVCKYTGHYCVTHIIGVDATKKECRGFN